MTRSDLSSQAYCHGRRAAVWCGPALVLFVLPGMALGFQAKQAMHPLREGLARPVEEMCKRIRAEIRGKGKAGASVALGSFTCFHDMRTGVGCGISQEVRGALSSATAAAGGGPEISVCQPGERARFEVSGRYRLQYQTVRGQGPLDEVNRVTAFRLQLWVGDRDNPTLCTTEVAIRREDLSADAFAQFIAVVTASDHDPPEQAPAKDAFVLWGLGRVWIESPGAASARPEASPGGAVLRSGWYDVQVRAHEKPRPAQRRKHDRFVDLRLGEEFSVDLVNKSDQGARVELLLDGVNSFAFSNEKYTHLFVPPRASVNVRGWHRTDAVSDQFVVTEKGRGAARQVPAPPNEEAVGTIIARFAPAEQVPEGTRGDAEIGRGRLIEQKYERVYCVVKGEPTTLSIVYRKPGAE